MSFSISILSGHLSCLCVSKISQHKNSEHDLCSFAQYTRSREKENDICDQDLKEVIMLFLNNIQDLEIKSHFIKYVLHAL